MKDFFLYTTELPMDSGFPLFGICHLLWLLGIGIFSWWMGRFFSFASNDKKLKARRVMGMLLPAIAICRDIVLLQTGHFEPEAYPLHLCNMSVWFATIYLWTRNRFVGVIYVLLCLPAAALALVFPGWAEYPFWNFMHIHSFVYHGLVVAVGYCIIRTGELLPEWKELWKPFVFGVSGYIILNQVNKLLGTNFWFISEPSYGSPLVWIYDWLGNKWYLIGHFLFCTLVVVLWHIILQKYAKRYGKRDKRSVGSM